MPGQEKTEQASAKRRRDERKKGNVFKSQEIISLGGLLAVFAVLQIFGLFMLETLTDGVVRFWFEAGVRETLSRLEAQEFFLTALYVFAVVSLPCLLTAALAAIIITAAQTRLNFSTEALQPKFSRLSPIQGFSKIFSIRGIVELVKSLLKIIILGYVIYSQYVERVSLLPRLLDMDFLNVLYFAAGFVWDIVVNVSVIFAFLAAADFLYQRWQYEKDMRMSKHELKEEYKQTEGDPQIKGKIKQKQREMSQARMMQAVPEADVIIRNPTHYAIAIKYTLGEDNAPKVLAKGADLMALRIIRVAEEHDIMLVENKALARKMYDNAPLDTEIPQEFYEAVAEVLAFVYSVRKRSLSQKLAARATENAKPQPKNPTPPPPS